MPCHVGAALASVAEHRRAAVPHEGWGERAHGSSLVGRRTARQGDCRRRYRKPAKTERSGRRGGQGNWRRTQRPAIAPRFPRAIAHRCDALLWTPLGGFKLSESAPASIAGGGNRVHVKLRSGVRLRNVDDADRNETRVFRRQRVLQTPGTGTRQRAIRPLVAAALVGSRFRSRRHNTCIPQSRARGYHAGAPSRVAEDGDGLDDVQANPRPVRRRVFPGHRTRCPQASHDDYGMGTGNTLPNSAVTFRRATPSDDARIRRYVEIWQLVDSCEHLTADADKHACMRRRA